MLIGPLPYGYCICAALLSNRLVLLSPAWRSTVAQPPKWESLEGTFCLAYLRGKASPGRDERLPQRVNGAMTVFRIGSQSSITSGSWGDDTSYSTYLMQALAFVAPTPDYATLHSASPLSV